jgi:hypothetical protein
MKVNWKHIITIILVCLLLKLLTGSFLMSLGILILLLLADNLIMRYEIKKQIEERMKDLDNEEA